MYACMVLLTNFLLLLPESIDFIPGMPLPAGMDNTMNITIIMFPANANVRRIPDFI